MYNSVQYLPLLFIIEHDRTQLGSVQIAIRQEDVLAKDLDDARKSGCAGLDDLTGDEVCVDDGNVVGFEESRDSGFAGSNSACEADNWVGGLGLVVECDEKV